MIMTALMALTTLEVVPMPVCIHVMFQIEVSYV